MLLITKTLTVYYECSKDERIPDVLYKTMKNYYELLKSKKIKLLLWGNARWYEGCIALNFLYEKYEEDWIKELTQILYEQGMDYLSHSHKWVRPLNMWRSECHIVNIAMMLKSEAVSYELLGAKYTDLAEKLSKTLKKYNGTAVGLFTGDECLSGKSPIQGSELCSVVEQMYSYELLYLHTRDRKWAERLEVLAFNALPATVSDDMWAHQYDQMSNQIACQRFPGRSIFRTNGAEAHMFGLEPNFGCCTANFSQGFPKLAISAFIKDGDTVESALMLPVCLEDGGIKISVDTEYPFKNKVKYSISTDRDFKFKIRIPSFAKNLKVNGKNTDTSDLFFSIPANTDTEIDVSFETEPYFEKRPNNLKTVKCGSLVFSLPIEYEAKMYEYERNGVERKFPYCDYEYIPKSDWNYAFSDTSLKLSYRDVSDIPSDSKNPPVVISAKVKKIDWGYEDGFETVCAKVPQSRKPISEEESIELYPYGYAKLRMTELPIIK